MDYLQAKGNHNQRALHDKPGVNVEQRIRTRFITEITKEITYKYQLDLVKIHNENIIVTNLLTI